MEKIEKLKDWWYSLFCPGYYEDMPKENKSGLWVAAAYRFGYWGDSYPSYDIMIGGNINAYRIARKFALKLDRETPYHGGEVGISWFIRPARPEEVESGYIDHKLN